MSKFFTPQVVNEICLEFIRNNSPELKSHVQQLLIDFDLIAEDCEQALLLNNHFDIKIEATKDFAKNIVEYFRKKSIYNENEYLSNFGFETLLKYFKSQLNTSYFYMSKLENFEEFNDVYGQYSAATALNITLIVCGKIAKEFYNDSGTITWKSANYSAEDEFSSFSLYDWENLDENTYNRLFYDLIENGK
uniref:Uncharacterized protein n=1 Tax=Panagrolaimus sp. JU765 TaxID=591449 RepID=A0AC34Q3R6_9BILA